MNFKNGEKVDAINSEGIVKYTGFYLGQGHPGANVPVADRSKLHWAIQVNNAGDVVYLDSFYWSLRQAR
jgi:hypothetical protein